MRELESQQIEIVEGQEISWDEVELFPSSDETVSKYVFTKNTERPAVAEAVLYRYPTFEKRTVVCCSTQSGCPVGCRFCGAGDNFVRSLTADEIIDQPKHIFESQNIDTDNVEKLQIMFMSMGEPMLNKRNLEEALVRLSDTYPNAALLISTSAPRVNFDWLHRLSSEIPNIGLQFSVHESTDEARDKLIPFKRKLTLKEIAYEGETWAGATGRQPFFNYCVHEGNNSQEDVDRLVELFNPNIWQATLSVISERDESVAAANERQRQLTADFMLKILEAGYSSRMFNPAGQDDIGGGCGQLWYVQEWMKNNPDFVKPSFGNGLQKLHAPSLKVKV